MITFICKPSEGMTRLSGIFIESVAQRREPSRRHIKHKIANNGCIGMRRNRIRMHVHSVSKKYFIHEGY